jgi:hypothetical protein
MLVIRKAQIEALSEGVVDSFKHRLTAYLIGRFPVDAAVIGEAGLRALVDRVVPAARALGLDASGEVARFVVLAVYFGSAFADDPQLPWATAELAHAEAAPAPLRRIDRLYVGASDWLRQTAGTEGEYYRDALQRNYRRPLDAFVRLTAEPGEDGARAWLREVYPRKAEHVGPAELDRVCRQGTRDARRHGLSGLAAERAYAALSFMLGTCFDEDPLYPWAPDLLARAAALGPAEAGAALHHGVVEQIGVYRRAGAVIGA